MPDIGLTTLNDMKDNAFLIANLDRSVPLIADADSGYGGNVVPLPTVLLLTQPIPLAISSLL